MLLVFAAAKKFDPARGLESGMGGSLATLAVVLEFAFGVWVLSGVHARFAKTLLSVVLGVFCLISLVAALRGEASCGCFGDLRVDPRYAAILDATLLLAILLTPYPPPFESGNHPRGTMKRLAMATAFSMALAGIVVSFDGAGPDPVLRPETWVGRHFPIAGNVSFAGQAVDLDDGEWLVVFYDDSCSHCRVLIPSILRWCESGATTPVAFVAVTPPTARGGGLVPPRRFEAGSRVVSGQLDGSRPWFVRTPSLVHLVDGVVSPGGWPPRFLELAEGRG